MGAPGAAGQGIEGQGNKVRRILRMVFGEIGAGARLAFPAFHGSRSATWALRALRGAKGESRDTSRLMGGDQAMVQPKRALRFPESHCRG
jgi:hypothetical protein